MKLNPKIFKIVTVSLMSVILGVSLVYYNFIYDSKPINTSSGGSSLTKDVYEKGDACPGIDIPYYIQKDTEFVKEGVYNVENNRGKISIINFWYTYCTPCIAEIPHFEEIANEYKDDVSVIAIAGIIFGNEAETIKSKQWDKYTMIFGEDTDSQYYTLLGGNGMYPHTVIVDQQGVITEIFARSIQYQDLKNVVDSLL